MRYYDLIPNLVETAKGYLKHERGALGRLIALRHLRPDESQQFSRPLQWLIESDEQIEVFAFVLQKNVCCHFASLLGKTRSTIVVINARLLRLKAELNPEAKK